ncbi:MAG TPA: hypothetical protein PKL06_06335 [Chitinophagales bacterium]|nr:hypothetical protein [Chitinophagales bacterium]
MRILIQCSCLTLLCLATLRPVSAQEVDNQSDMSSNVLEKFYSGLHFSGYGVVNYYHFDWETLPDKNDALDPERMNLYMYYPFTDRIQLKTEIEFEHGGTGTTMSFDPLEEFGEFEPEVEKGGEVVLEQMNILFQLNNHMAIRAGKFRVFMGNAAMQDEPNEYFTGYRSEVENTVLPLGWYETGIELNGIIPLSADFPRIEYKAYLMSGLDNSAFSSANWIRRGYQTRFEMINADAMAFASRFDLVLQKDHRIGIAAYAGNPSENRPKDDFNMPSWVTFGDIHYALTMPAFRLSAYGMMGHVQNSEALSEANRNLSNNLGVKRTPVGKAAAGAYIEAGYDVLHPLAQTEWQCFVFGRFDWYDTMFQTAGEVSDNPRYARTVYTAGINVLPIEEIALKAHYAYRTLGSGETENTFLIGLGFEF